MKGNIQQARKKMVDDVVWPLNAHPKEHAPSNIHKTNSKKYPRSGLQPTKCSKPLLDAHFSLRNLSPKLHVQQANSNHGVGNTQ